VPEADRYIAVVGFNNRVTNAIDCPGLRRRDERERSAQEIPQGLFPAFSNVAGVLALMVSVSSLLLRLG
jgi:hypothetical protein